MTAAPVVLPYELLSILEEIDRAIHAGLYYAALTTMLTLPDLCAATELSRSQHVRKEHYVGFLTNFAVPQEVGCSPDLLYQLRGGIIHRGNAAGHTHWPFTHMVITPPGSPGVHGILLLSHDKTQQALTLDLTALASALRNAVYRWYAAVGERPEVQSSLGKLCSIYPKGLHPFITGGPIIVSVVAD